MSVCDSTATQSGVLVTVLKCFNEHYIICKPIYSLEVFFLVAEPDATSEDITTVPSVMQWITGQAHRHLLLSDRQNFKITVKFDHDCHKMPNHTICYPTVSACTDTITFPVAHMSDYGSFKNVMTTAIKYGAGFDRAWCIVFHVCKPTCYILEYVRIPQGSCELA